MMPDVIEKSTDTAKRAAETVADATRRGAEIATNVGEKSLEPSEAPPTR